MERSPKLSAVRLTGEEFANAAGDAVGRGPWQIGIGALRLRHLRCRFYSSRWRDWRAPTRSSSTRSTAAASLFRCARSRTRSLAANTQTIHGGCPAGTGNDDTIEFIVTGTIFPDNTLTLNNSSETLFIEGPAFGGITIDGQNND